MNKFHVEVYEKKEVKGFRASYEVYADNYKEAGNKALALADYNCNRLTESDPIALAVNYHKSYRINDNGSKLISWLRK